MLETITNNKKCSRFTLNNRGITLASLTIYVVVATIVVGILAFLNAQFFSNITELTNESSIASENLKLKASLVRDLKSRDVNVLEYSNWGFRLSNNVKYEIRYNEKDDNYAVFRNNVKICSSIYATEVDGVQSPYFKYNPENNTLSLDLQFADSKNGSYSSLNRENNTFLVSNIRKKNEVAVKTKYEYESHITYDLNNGTSSEVIEPQTAMVGSDIRVTTIEPTKRRSTFLGWSTNKDAEEPDYLPGSKFKGDLDTTLYAIYRSSLITSIANKPVLGNGMTGVYYDENQNEIPVAKVSYLNSAINTKNGLNGTMYNYLVGDGVTDTKETKWANAKTEDGSYWVWVPRYAYKITYYTDETKLVESNTKTKYGDIDVLFLYETRNDAYRDINGRPVSPLPSGYKVHPAFQAINSEEIDASLNHLGKWNVELEGIWVAKYAASKENSTDGTNWVANGNTDSGGANTLTTNAGNTSSTKVRVVSKPNVVCWRKARPPYAFPNCEYMYPALNTHLMKNSEWGATAYLAYSAYGRNNHDVSANQNTNKYTGGGPGIGDNQYYNSNYSASLADFLTTYAWNTPQGMLASTTGNAYGIYDMSGLTNELVAGYLNTSNIESHTHYGVLVTTEKRHYIQMYSIGADENNARDNYNANANVYGDAMYETSIGTNLNFNDQNTNAFENSSSMFLFSDNAGIARGGNVLTYTTGNFGLFNYGVKHDNNNAREGFRPVICVSNTTIVRYDPNGGMLQDVPAYANVASDGNLYLTNSRPVYVGAEFLGWSFNKNAKTAQYHPGDVVTHVEGDTIYAIWSFSDAVLVDGLTFNLAIKKLAGDDTFDNTGTNNTTDSIDNVITAIEWSTTRPPNSLDIAVKASTNLNSINENTALIEISSSKSSIYAWRTGGTIKLWTEANKVYLNDTATDMFKNLQGLTTLDVTRFDSSQSTKMNSLFNGCINLESVDYNFDTSKATTIAYLFYNCSKLESIDVSDFDTSKVTDMRSTFAGCSSLRSLDITNFDTHLVNTMEATFKNLTSITELDLSSFDTGNVNSFNNCFNGCSKLETIYATDNLCLKNNSTNINGAFNGCPKLYGGLGTPNKNIDRSFFKIDQGIDNPGLFTSKDKVEFVYIYVDDNEDEQVIREEYTFGSNVTIYDPMSSTFEIMTWTNVSNTKTYDPGAVINNARKGDTVYGRVSRLEYTHDDEITFDGTFYIDTGVYLFNNHDDFEVSFEVTQNYGMNNGNTKEATIFHAKRETVQNFWPGISIDVNNSASNKYNTKIRVSSSIYIANDITNNTGKFTILRVNDRIYLLVNGVQFGNTLDYSGYNTYFDSPATFGAAVKNPETMEMMRYWKGKIKNLHVKKGGPIDLSDYGL